jgi:hypothetical protein
VRRIARLRVAFARGDELDRAATVNIASLRSDEAKTFNGFHLVMFDASSMRPMVKNKR